MKPLPLLLLLCCAASGPPLPPGATKLYSPKDAEFRRSLARSITPSLHRSNAPFPHASTFQRFNALTPQFQITNLTVSPGSATVEWQGGIPPVWVFKSPDLLNWQPDGDPTLRNSHTIATTAAQMFFRVRQAVPLLSAQTNQPRLIWRIPELMPADTFASFKIERSDSGVIGDETTNGTLSGSPVTLATLTNKTTVGGAGFRIPVPGANVIKDASGNAISSVTVGDSSWMTDPLGAVYLNVPGKGLFKVISRPDATHVVLQYDISNDQASGTIPPSVDHQGENVLAGAQLLPGSFNDPTQPNPSLFYRVTGKTANNIDTVENVVSLSISKPGDFLWLITTSAAGAANDYVEAIAKDSAGNIIIAGARGTSIFLEKYSTSKALLWSHQFTAVGEARAIVVDAADNVYFTGAYQGSANFGGATLPGTGSFLQVFVAKYDKDGNHLHSVGFTSLSSCEGRGMAVDIAGNVLLTGYCGNVDFGGGTIGSGYGPNIFALKLNGSTLGHIASTGYGSGYGYAVAVDSGTSPVNANGNIILTGSSPVCNFGAGTLPNNGGYDVFVAKVKALTGSSGDHVWSKNFGGNLQDSGNAVLVTPSDDVILGGSFQNSMTIGGVTITASGGASDGFIVKLLGSDGSAVWPRPIQIAGSFTVDDAVSSLAIDASGNIIAAGRINGSSTYGGTVSIPGSGGSCYMAKYKPDSTLLWAKPISVVVNQDLGVCVANNDGVFLGGFWAGPTDFGDGNTISPTGGYDLFLLKLVP